MSRIIECIDKHAKVKVLPTTHSVYHVYIQEYKMKNNPKHPRPPNETHWVIAEGAENRFGPSDGTYIEKITFDEPVFQPYVLIKSKVKLSPFRAWEYFRDRDYIQYYLSYILNDRANTPHFNMRLNRLVYEIYRWGTKNGFDPKVWRTGPQDFVPPVAWYHNPQEWWEELSILLPIANFGIYVKLLTYNLGLKFPKRFKHYVPNKAEHKDIFETRKK